MNHIDVFLRNVESRYPQIYQMLNGDKARMEFEDRNQEMERMRKIIDRRQQRIVAHVTPSRVVRTEKLGGRRSQDEWMEAVPIIVIR
jgi:hypothetical protein